MELINVYGSRRDFIVGQGSNVLILLLEQVVFTIPSWNRKTSKTDVIGINNSDPLYALHFKCNAFSPSYIHMEATGTNTVGGAGGIAFDTSASNALSNNTLYLATITGIRKV